MKELNKILVILTKDAKKISHSQKKETIIKNVKNLEKDILKNVPEEFEWYIVTREILSNIDRFLNSEIKFKDFKKLLKEDIMFLRRENNK